MFTLTNLALFVFLPFAYLLCESEGFIGAKRGLIPRAKVFRNSLLDFIRDQEPILKTKIPSIGRNLNLWKV
jgi:hypothetical protein